MRESVIQMGGDAQRTVRQRIVLLNIMQKLQQNGSDDDQ